MMNSAREQIVAALHQAPLQLVLNLTGGGSFVVSDLLTVPGASKIVLAVHIPNAQAALQATLQRPIEQACSSRTARIMAMSAWSEGQRLLAPTDPRRPEIVGLGCTASLASQQPKRGPHRLHLALQTFERTITWSLELTKQARTRAAEERLVADAMLNQLATLVGVKQQLDLGLLPDELAESAQYSAPTTWQQLVQGTLRATTADGSQTLDSASPNITGRAVFSGSFDPLHNGHRQMAELAARRTGLPVMFEIAIRNVDKPALDYLELANRAKQFTNPASVWFTNCSTFVEKSALFSPVTFIVGADTIQRLAEPRYYADRQDLMQQAIATLTARQARFLVFTRRDQAGRLITLEDLALPETLQNICEQVPSSEFVSDLSSTEIRRGLLE